jgi:hypothetical protein
VVFLLNVYIIYNMFYGGEQTDEEIEDRMEALSEGDAERLALFKIWGQRKPRYKFSEQQDLKSYDLPKKRVNPAALGVKHAYDRERKDTNIEMMDLRDNRGEGKRKSRRVKKGKSRRTKKRKSRRTKKRKSRRNKKRKSKRNKRGRK